MPFFASKYTITPPKVPPTSPPNAPEIVFIGLIFGQSLGPLIVDPTKYAIVSVSVVQINSNNIALIDCEPKTARPVILDSASGIK
mgnify:CR=1 FL=1